MAKFRKRPVIIEAIEFESWDISALCTFLGFVPALETDSNGEPEGLYIPTLEGLMSARLRDWIIKGVKGKFYLCKPDIFEATYEEIVDG